MAEKSASIAPLWNWLCGGAGVLLVMAWLIARHDEKGMFSQDTLENDFGPAFGPPPREEAQRTEGPTVPAALY